METESKRSTEDLHELRQRGNRCFAQEDWKRAIHFYSLCIQKVQSAVNSPPLFHEDAQPIPPEQSRNHDLLFSHSNRAEAWLRLKVFEKALADCDAALEIDSRHIKSLYRKGRALHGLQQYEDAIVSLRSVLQQAPHNDEIQSYLEKSLKFESQSRTGKYDISKYLLSGRKEDAPEVSDYVGDVVIESTADGRGRGLFAARNVKAGDLLLVSNAFAISYGGEYGTADEQMKSDLERKLIAGAVDRAMSSRQAMRQLYTLAYSSNQETMQVPPMDLFRPNKSYPYCKSLSDGHEAADDMPINVGRVKNILQLNPFGGSTKDICFSGLWILPSFLNHSCLPNTSTLHVGEAMFVHATRNISRGQELTTNYFDLLTPYAERSRNCRRLQFACRCWRCNLEQSLPTWMREAFQDRGSRSAIRAQIFRAEDDDFAKFVTQLEKEMKSPEHMLKTEEKHWIRSSHAKIYLRAFPAGDFPEEENLAHSLQLTVPGNPTFLLVASKFAKMAKSNSQLKKMSLQMTREACVAAIGNQDKRVLQSFIRDPLSLFPFFF